MTDTHEQLRWQAKVAAWVHDPPEKALVLLRDPTGHTGGTVAKLCREVFPPNGAVPEELASVVQRADWWAAAADRPQFPRDAQRHYQPWTRVDFAKSPVLIHPLSGTEYDLKNLEDVRFEAIKAVSLDHFERLIVKLNGAVDWKQTFLQLWRFGPESPAPGLGGLWRVLPAETRVPDHSIWEHLRLVSAFAGAMVGGDTPALLSVSLGPVQSFIAQARSTSDLWAASHLLSRLAWEAMKVVCDQFGPDAILFPDLHGVPLVDLWLEDTGVRFEDDERTPDWKRFKSDANPLFSATLPNRFLALVPNSQARGIADEITREVRKWAREQAGRAWTRILEVAGRPDEEGKDGREQLARQFAEFPEIYWAAAPWSLIQVTSDAKVASVDCLQAALGTFVPAANARKPGFLGTTAWDLLSKKLTVEGSAFFEPYPGVLYPALYDLTDRASAAAKTARRFAQQPEYGYRCTLCGEREWLTTDRAQLDRARGSTGEEDVWRQVHAQRPAWAREGEHLCACCALKRLWPALFAEEVRTQVQDLAGLQRYVVSTHTMALASTLNELVGAKAKLKESPAFQRLQSELQSLQPEARVSLPRRLAQELDTCTETVADVVRGLPAVLDDLREQAREARSETKQRAFQRKRRAIETALEDTLQEIRGNKERWRPEAYYAVLLMDGDHMGAWLSGTGSCGRPRYAELWHPQIRAEVNQRAQASTPLDKYLTMKAPVSPAYHTALSRALNGFSSTVARIVVEELHLGKVIYAGGDDLLAMVGVRDLLSVMLALRCAYSGEFPGRDEEAVWQLLGVGRRLRLGGGHALHVLDWGKQLIRMMGEKASASIGAVVAHHMAPLGAVLRELRAAEQRAKREGGRDAFSIALIKRSGGATYFTSQWMLRGIPAVAPDQPPESSADRTAASVLLRLKRALSETLSRRAAYHMISWLTDLPAKADAGGELNLDESTYTEMIAQNLAYQMYRQRKDKQNPAPELDALAQDLADLAIAEVKRRGSPEASVPAFLRESITLAEFLARAERGEDGGE